MIWACKGIKVLKDITSEGELCTFDQLKARHDLPNSFFFRYLQLRHAFKEQFTGQRIEYLPSLLENILLEEDLVKPLSSVYKSLFKKTPLGSPNVGKDGRERLQISRARIGTICGIIRLNI